MLLSIWERYKINTENTKKPKIPNFYRFNASFVNVLIDIVDWNAENVQQGTNSFFSRLYQDLNSVF